MVNVWITALKKWNNKKGGTWCVPRKNSKEYNSTDKTSKKTDSQKCITRFFK